MIMHNVTIYVVSSKDYIDMIRHNVTIYAASSKHYIVIDMQKISIYALLSTALHFYCHADLHYLFTIIK